MPKLKIEFRDEGSAEVSVYNGFNQRVINSIERSNTVDLTPGLYSIQIRRGSDISEQVINLKNEDKVVKIDPPPHYSAVPLFGTVTTHEYYAYTSQEISNKETAQQIGLDSDQEIGQLFIFIRAASSENYDGKPLGRGLSLMHARMEMTITNFDSNDIIENTNDGWLGYSVKASSGYYRLRFKDENRELPIYVFRGWQTQVFITYNKGPKSDSITILMSRMGTGFNPDEKQQLAVDLALQSLKSGSGWLPNDAMQLLLHGKFENPILGLLGGHLLLRREEMSPKPNSNRRNTIHIVLENLRMLIGDAPDVLALETRASLLFRNEVQGIAMEPPMIRLGNEALIQAAANNINLVPEDSEIARLAKYLYADSVWTSWDLTNSFEYQISMGLTSNWSLTNRKTQSLENDSADDRLLLNAMSLIKNIDPLTKVSSFNEEVETEENWVQKALSTQLSSNDKLNDEIMVKMSLDLGLPQSVVLHELKGMSIDKNIGTINLKDLDDSL